MLYRFFDIYPLLTCVNSHRRSVLRDRQRWTQSESSHHIDLFDWLQQSMTISWIPVATETERNVTTHSQTAVVLASGWNSDPIFYALKPLPAALGASSEAVIDRCPTVLSKPTNTERVKAADGVCDYTSKFV